MSGEERCGPLPPTGSARFKLWGSPSLRASPPIVPCDFCAAPGWWYEFAAVITGQIRSLRIQGSNLPGFVLQLSPSALVACPPVFRAAPPPMQPARSSTCVVAAGCRFGSQERNPFIEPKARQHLPEFAFRRGPPPLPPSPPPISAPAAATLACADPASPLRCCSAVPSGARLITKPGVISIGTG